MTGFSFIHFVIILLLLLIITIVLSLQTLLESMVDAAESLCPHVMKRSHLRSELVKASAAKTVVPLSFVSKTLLEQSGVDIVNKIRCVCVCMCVRCIETCSAARL